MLVVVADGMMLFRNRLNAKISQKNFLKGVGTEYLIFNDEALFARNNKGEGKYFYEAFTELYTDGERYYLLADKKHAIILPKRSFTEGDPETFAAFFAEKTGLAIQTIKC